MRTSVWEKDVLAYLLTGSLIATRKSWACSTAGEKASRIM